jgi:hypothetical protein
LSSSNEGELLQGAVTVLEEAVEALSPSYSELIVDFEGWATKNFGSSLLSGMEGGNFTVFTPVKSGIIQLPLHVRPRGDVSQWRIVNAIGQQLDVSKQDCLGPLPASCACDKTWMHKVDGYWTLQILPKENAKTTCFWNLRLEQRQEEGTIDL